MSLCGTLAARAEDCAALYNNNCGANGYFASPALTAGETLEVQLFPGANGTFKIQNAPHTTTYASYTSTTNSSATINHGLVPSTGICALDSTESDGSSLVGCGVASPSSGTITTVVAYAVTPPSAYNFGSVTLPGSATQTLTFTIPSGGGGSIASVSVVTMGAANLDFTKSGSDTAPESLSLRRPHARCRYSSSRYALVGARAEFCSKAPPEISCLRRMCKALVRARSVLNRMGHPSLMLPCRRRTCKGRLAVRGWQWTATVCCTCPLSR